jgi:hypothetical protein
MDNYNFAGSDFPKGDYALAVLSHTAMHTRRPTEESNPLAYDRERHSIRNVTSEVAGTSLSNQASNLRTRVRSQDRIPNMLSDYNSTILSPRNMDTLAFNPSSMAQDQNSYAPRGYQSIGSQISQNYANNLGILNAESYDDGRGSLRRKDAEQIRASMRNEKTMPFGVEQPLPRIGFENQGTGSEEDATGKGRRKKRKDDSADEEEEARKKARGRPRVDTKDETAADRRRTQIRMAQRAYRHRKETTISSLEKQVQDLRGTNEEMSNIFINLYDFAISKGLLQREPEFGQQLQSTTERFLALAKTTQDENQHDSTHEYGKIEDGEPARPTKGRRASPKKQQEANPPVESTSSWGGYTLSKDDSPVEEIDMGFQQNSGYRRHDDLQIITRPTEENASFPFDLMDLQTYRVEVPEIEDFSQNFFPQSQPPLPKSHSYNEFSFARRIHRAAVERAFKLITSNDPADAARRDRVFGLCMLYESNEEIEARLKRVMAKSTKESLQEWRAPFVHVGGAGTSYPVQSGDVSGDLMPKFRTGYSMGPFSPSVARVAEMMDDDIRCNLPGFEGDFFDPNDVEGYLRGRGLDIAPSADFVTGELDLTGLIEAPSPKSATSDSVPSIASPKTPRSPIGSFALDTDRNIITSNLDFQRSGLHPSKVRDCLTFPIGFTNWASDTSEINSNFIDPIFDSMPGQKSEKVSPGSAMSERNSGERQRVTVNVKTLLDGRSSFNFILVIKTNC